MTLIGIVLVRNNIGTVHTPKYDSIEDLALIVAEWQQRGFEVYPIYAEQKL